MVDLLIDYNYSGILLEEYDYRVALSSEKSRAMQTKLNHTHEQKDDKQKEKKDKKIRVDIFSYWSIH